MSGLVLASGSPRRKEILELLGLDFEVAESLINEELIRTDDPVELVEELALQKAVAVAERYPDAIIVAGDTTVDIGTEQLAKANTKTDAKAMIKKLSGRTHRVLTGVAVVNSLTGDAYIGHEEGVVTFRNVSEEELEKYAQDEKNWRGFAGAYAMQGGAAKFVLSQTGKLSAIVGLPVELLVGLLEEAGVLVEADPREVEDQLRGMRVGIED